MDTYEHLLNCLLRENYCRKLKTLGVRYYSELFGHFGAKNREAVKLKNEYPFFSVEWRRSNQAALGAPGVDGRAADRGRRRRAGRCRVLPESSSQRWHQFRVHHSKWPTDDLENFPHNIFNRHHEGMSSISAEFLWTCETTYHAFRQLILAILKIFLPAGRMCTFCFVLISLKDLCEKNRWYNLSPRIVVKCRRSFQNFDHMYR